ncbi:33127_t:CDS:1, partial [Gigaspora margarita]
EDDGHGHFGATCRYCDKGKWQRGKPSIMKAHLALHCKEQVLDDIRKKWLIEIAKRDEKVNDEKDAESPIRKKNKMTINQLPYTVKPLTN